MEGLLIFCEYLIYRCYQKDDFAADMTLNGIIHFLNKAKFQALDDDDIEEYKKYANLVDKIYNWRDTARSIKRIQMREDQMREEEISSL